MDILERSWQDLGTILAKILSRSCHGINFAMVRSYQESQDASKRVIINSGLLIESVFILSDIDKK